MWLKRERRDLGAQALPVLVAGLVLDRHARHRRRTCWGSMAEERPPRARDRRSTVDDISFDMVIRARAARRRSARRWAPRRAAASDRTVAAGAGERRACDPCRHVEPARGALVHDQGGVRRSTAYIDLRHVEHEPHALVSTDSRPSRTGPPDASPAPTTQAASAKPTTDPPHPEPPANPPSSPPSSRRSRARAGSDRQKPRDSDRGERGVARVGKVGILAMGEQGS